jgi:hypothetical protein
MGFDLNDDGTGAKPKLTFDASAFDGITFVAKGANSEAVKVGVAIPATVYEGEGGTCSEADNKAEKCSDIHMKSIKLTADWQRYVIAFSDLKQGAWGTPATFNKKTLIGVQFNMEAVAKYDIAVDDISFYKNK